MVNVLVKAESSFGSNPAISLWRQYLEEFLFKVAVFILWMFAAVEIIFVICP